MLLIPVIEIKNGKPSRMIEGFDCNSAFHSCDILTLAKLFRKENAKCIHITDLDCATSGELVNYHMLKKVIDSVGIPVQLGGGIRNLSIAKKLLEELGIYRLVLGTAVSENLSLLENLLSEYGPSKLVVSIDVKDGYCMKTGWKEKSKISSVQFAKELKKLGLLRIIYQDVSKVGTFSGPNIEGLKEIASESGLKISAAGGIGSYKDLKVIQELEKFGVDSVLIYRALYENRFPCQAIWREAEKNDESLDLPVVRLN